MRIGWLAIAALSVSCTEPEPTATCPPGQIDIGGTCRDLCNHSTDCNGGLACVDGVCGPPCSGDGDCPEGAVCASGVCLCSDPSECDIQVGCNGNWDQARLAQHCNAAVMGAHVATWDCVNHNCTVDACAPGFVDLDAVGGNGCEYACSTTGTETCDRADNECNGVVDDIDDEDADCRSKHTGATDVNSFACVSGACMVVTCGPGFSDVNGEVGDGCESNCVVTNSGVEICDGVDNDCDGVVDNAIAGAPGCTVYYRDADDDGHGVEVDNECWCAPTGDYKAMAGDDCDDSNSLSFPGAVEILDGEDNDCDDATDECVGDCDCDSAELVACYLFEGDTLDGSTHGNDGSGPVTFEAGKVGQAVRTRPGQYVRVDDDHTLDIHGPLTVEAWVFPETVGERGGVLDNDGQYSLFVHAGDLFRCSARISGQTSVVEAPLRMGDWNHLACRWTGAELEAWHDGVLVASLAATGLLSSNNDDEMYIGANSPIGNDGLDGLIDMARVWRIARSAEQICADAGACP